MDASTIISMTRNQTYTNSANFPDGDIVDYLNMVYADMANAITTVDENFFYEVRTTDLVSGQNEYTLPGVVDSTTGIQKIINVGIKYSSEADYYTKAKEMSFGALSRSVDYFETNQSFGAPFFIIADNSLFVYPTPTQDITDGLRLDGIIILSDLTTTSSTSDIKIPIQYHHILVLGIKQYVFAAQGKINEKNDAKQEYEQAKQNMLKEISDRSLTPAIGIMPDLEGLA